MVKRPTTLQHNKFIAPAIKSFILENMARLKEEILHIDHNYIVIYSVLGEEEEGEHALPSAAAKIFTTVSNLAAATARPPPPIHCYLFLLNFPKMLNLSQRHITSAECNSGSTTFRKKTKRHDAFTEIVLWRREEWKKVFYHELIHAFHIHDVILPQKKLDATLGRLLPYYNNTIQEAYTEILASLLAFPATDKSALKDQTLFMGCQVNKIIYYYTHAHGIQAFFKKKENNNDDKPECNFASYYILKCIYLWASLQHPTLLHVANLLDPQFINKHFYPVLINALDSGEYAAWLERIFFTPKDLSLRLTM